MKAKVDPMPLDQLLKSGLVKIHTAEEGREVLAQSLKTEETMPAEEPHLPFSPSLGRPKAGVEREESEVFSVRVPKSFMVRITKLSDAMNITRNRLAMIALQRQVIDPINEAELRFMFLKKSVQLKAAHFIPIGSNEQTGTIYSTVTGAMNALEIVAEQKPPFNVSRFGILAMKVNGEDVHSGAMFPGSMPELCAAGGVDDLG